MTIEWIHGPLPAMILVDTRTARLRACCTILLEMLPNRNSPLSRLKTILYLTTVAVLGIPGPNTGFTRFTRSANTISCRGVIGLGI